MKGKESREFQHGNFARRRVHFMKSKYCLKDKNSTTHRETGIVVPLDKHITEKSVGKF